MVGLPWGRGGEEAPSDPRPDIETEPVITCAFQDGTLYVYEDHVFIERAGPSKFEDKIIPRSELVDVIYEKGIAIGYLQLEQSGFTTDEGGFLTSPIDENTLHFGRRDRACAERAREELLFGGE